MKTKDLFLRRAPIALLVAAMTVTSSVAPTFAAPNPVVSLQEATGYVALKNSYEQTKQNIAHKEQEVTTLIAQTGNAKSALDTTTTNLTEKQNERSQKENDYADALETVVQKENAELQKLKTAWDNAVEAYNTAVSDYEAKAAIVTAKTEELENIKNSTDAEEIKKEAIASATADVAAANAALAAAEQAKSDASEALKNARNNYKQAQEEYVTTQNAIPAAKEALETAQATLTEANAAYEEAYKTAKTNAEDSLHAAQSDKERQIVVVAQAEEALAEAKSNREAAKADVAEKSAALDAVLEELSDVSQYENTQEYQDLQTAISTLNMWQQNYDEVSENLESSQEYIDETETDLTAATERLAELKAAVEEATTALNEAKATREAFKAQCDAFRDEHLSGLSEEDEGYWDIYAEYQDVWLEKLTEYEETEWALQDDYYDAYVDAIDFEDNDYADAVLLHNDAIEYRKHLKDALAEIQVKVDAAQLDYQNKKIAYDNMVATGSSDIQTNPKYIAAQEAYNTATEALAVATTAYNDANGVYNTATQTLAGFTEVAESMQNVLNQVEEINTDYNAETTYASTLEGLVEKKTAVIAAQETLDKCESVYTELQEQLTDLAYKIETYPYQISEMEEALEIAEANLTKAWDVVKEAEDRLVEANAINTETAKAEAITLVTSELETATANMNEAASVVETNNTAVTNAKNAYDAQEEVVTALSALTFDEALTMTEIPEGLSVVIAETKELDKEIVSLTNEKASCETAYTTAVSNQEKAENELSALTEEKTSLANELKAEILANAPASSYTWVTGESTSLSIPIGTSTDLLGIEVDDITLADNVCSIADDNATFVASYMDSLSFGSHTATFIYNDFYKEIMGSDTATATITVSKEKTDVAACVIEDVEDAVYTGKAIAPAVTVKEGNNVLVKDTDYTVAYSNNTEVGTATVTVTGIGNYKGTTNTTFKITEKDIEGCVIEKIANKTYTGKTQKPAVVVKNDNVTLKNGTDYKVTYTNNTEAGMATVTVEGTGNYKGSVTTTFKINAKSIAKASVSGIKAKYTYTGKNIVPGVVVKNGSVTLVKNKDYKVSVKNGKTPGLATVTITGKGNYTGTITKTFQILPKKSAVSSVKPASKAFTVKWKKTAQTTGYQIQYSTNKNFKSGNKLVIVKGAKTVSKKITKLKSKKTYYVRVRTFKTVNGKNYFSGWSTVKTVKTK